MPVPAVGTQGLDLDHLLRSTNVNAATECSYHFANALLTIQGSAASKPDCSAQTCYSYDSAICNVQGMSFNRVQFTVAMQ